MLRRAIQRARLHLPAPIGHENGYVSSASDDEEGDVESVAYTSLRDDEPLRDHLRTLPEDISGVHLLALDERRKLNSKRVQRLTEDEERRAADAWARLQTLYGLFKGLEAAVDDVEDVEEPQEERTFKGLWGSRQDDGLRSLLQETKLPSGVVLHELQKLEVADDGNGHMPMPQGFSASMFESLGNALYNEMLVAAEQNRISADALEELGNCLYNDAKVLAVSAAA